jgi:hypothetical protein
MESALLAYHSSLLTSNGCIPPKVANFDVQLASIIQPIQRICTNTFTPIVTITNRGLQTLTSLTINARVDNGEVSTFNWTGSLPRLSSANVTLNGMTVTQGNHILTVYTENPNNNPDEDRTNDTLSLAFQYYAPVTTVRESFESTTLPAGWDIVNPDGSVTWRRRAGVSYTGNASMMIDNFNNTVLGQKDDLRLPNVTLQNIDSAFLSFKIAAAVFTSLNTTNNRWDTLEVLVSTDCGQNYQSVYRKYGSNLVTKTTPDTDSFVPTSSQWRTDSVNLGGYLNQGNVLITFRNTTGHENNIYLDDINIRTVVINPNLKAQGFLITPNPTRDNIAVQFYPQPTNLRAIQVYGISGQKLVEINVSEGQASNFYNINMSGHASGTYIVRAVFSDRVITKKILKL